jgi:hypothetical protein
MNITIPSKKTTIALINVYIPYLQRHEAAPTRRATAIHHLENIIATTPPRHTLLVGGDVNTVLYKNLIAQAPFGPSPPQSEEALRASADFADMIQYHNLVPLSGTRSMPRHFTFNAPTGDPDRRRWTTLDHFFFRPKQLRVADFRRLPRPFPSDHYPIVLRLPFRQPYIHNPPQRPLISRPDCSALLPATASSDHPEHAARQSFLQPILQHLGTTPLAIASYDAFVAAVHTGAVTLPPTQRHKLRRPAHDDETIQIRHAINTIDLCDDELRTLHNRITSRRTEIQTEDIHHFCSLFSQFIRTRSREAYHALGTITCPKTANASIAGATKAERLQKIAQTCASQLQNSKFDRDIQYPAFPTHLNYNEQPFTMAELTTAVAHISRGKAPGPDSILTDYLKLPELADPLLSLMNDCLATGTTPPSFRKTMFHMIPKPGADHRDPAGWRYIALMSATAKLYDKLLHARLSSVIDPHLRWNQNGFRPKRGTMQHIITLHHLYEQLSNSKGSGCFTFIDYSNAFPSVSWSAIRAALKAYHVPQALITAVLSMYEGHTAFVNTPDGPTDPFSPTAGVLQGDTLAPFLFILVLDCIMHLSIPATAGITIVPGFRTPNKRGYKAPITLSDLNYADDIALCTPTTAQTQPLLTALEKHSNAAGLFLNIKKTKFMVVGHHPPHPKLTITTGSLEQVNDYKYLGVYFNRENDVLARIAQASQRMKLYQRVWRSPILSAELRYNLWRTMIAPILLYPATALSLTPACGSRLRGCMTRMLRRVLSIP